MTRWLAAVGAIVVSLDSMVNIAFPAMAAWFERPPESMRWVIIAYVLTYSLASFAAGTAADRLGLVRVFRLGLGVSAVAFGAAAAAHGFGWLVAARVLQGVAGGMIYGTAPALVTLAARPEARGRALGVLNGSIGFAFATGPVTAGWLVQTFGWQAVFAVRVPIALAAFVWAWRVSPEARTAVGHRLVRPAEILRAPVVRACVLAFLANAGIFAIWLLAPFYLVEQRGLDPFVAGLFFMLTPLGTGLAAPLAGRAADRFGPRAPAVAGLVVETAGLLAMGQVNDMTPAAVVAGALFAAGFGLGVFQVPNMAAVMSAFPPGQQGAAGGLAFMARTLGVVSGVATFATIFAARRAAEGFEPAFAAAFALAAGAVGLAALVATFPSRVARP